MNSTFSTGNEPQTEVFVVASNLPPRPELPVPVKQGVAVHFDILARGLLEVRHPKPISLVKKAVASVCDVTVADLESRSRAVEITEPRKLAFYICVHWRLGSLEKIGEEFGGRDKGTTDWGARGFVKLLETEKRKWESRLILCLQALAAQKPTNAAPEPV